MTNEIKNNLDKITSQLWQILRRGKATTEEVRFLVDCLSCSSAVIRSNAAHIIGSLKIKSAFDSLVDAMSNGGSATFYFSVVQFGPSVVSILGKRLERETSIAFRKNTAFVMGYFPSPESYKILCQLIKDDSHSVRRVAVYSLRYFVKFGAKKLLEEILNKEKNLQINAVAQKSLDYIS